MSQTLILLLSITCGLVIVVYVYQLIMFSNRVYRTLGFRINKLESLSIAIGTASPFKYFKDVLISNHNHLVKLAVRNKYSTIYYDVIITELYDTQIVPYLLYVSSGVPSVYRELNRQLSKLLREQEEMYTGSDNGVHMVIRYAKMEDYYVWLVIEIIATYIDSLTDDDYNKALT